MKIFNNTLFLVLFFASIANSFQSTITEGEGYACMGDDKSRKQTEEHALLEAKRNAVEKTQTYLTSKTYVKNFSLEKDIVQAFSSATIRLIDELEKHWYKDQSSGDCLKMRIRAEVAPDESIMNKFLQYSENPTAPLKVKIWTDKKEYKECDKVKVFIKGNKPFFARVIYKDATGNITQILPNSYRDNNYFNGNVIYEIPSGPDKFDLSVSTPFGSEEITVLASTVELGDIDIFNNGGVYLVKTQEKEIGLKSRGIKIKEKSAELKAAEFFEEKTIIKTTNGNCSETKSTIKPIQPDIEMIVQRGHSSFVRDIAFSPDGKFVASNADGVIKLWKIDGTLVRIFDPANSFGVTSVAFSPDGNFIVGGLFDKTVRIWRVVDGLLINTLEGHTTGVESIAYSPDGLLIASVAGIFDVEIRIWQASSGKLLQTIKVNESSIGGIAFSPDGTIVACGCSASASPNQNQKASIRFWRVSDGIHLRTIPADSNKDIFNVIFSPDGKYIAGSIGNRTYYNTTNREIGLWQVSDGKPITTIYKKDELAFSKVKFSPDGKYIASGTFDNSFAKHIQFWRVPDGAPIKKIRWPFGIINGLSFSPDGKYFAIGDEHGKISIHNAIDGTVMHQVDEYSYKKAVNYVAVNKRENTIVSGSREGMAFWSLYDGSLVRKIQMPKDQWTTDTYYKAISPDGKIVVRVGAHEIKDNKPMFTIALLNAQDGTVIKTLPGHSANNISAVAFSPDSSILASSSWSFSRDGDLKLWRISDGTLIKDLGILGMVKNITFSPDGKNFAVDLLPHNKSLDRDSFLQFRQTSDGALVRKFKGTEVQVGLSVFSPDGSMIASAIETDGTLHIKLFQVFDGSLIKKMTFPGETDSHAYGSSLVAFSPDGSFLASTHGNSIKLINVSDGKLIKTFKEYTYPSPITFTPDGRHLISSDKAIKMWNVSTGNSMHMLSHDAEWIIYTSDGYFDASKKGGKLIAMVKEKDAWGVDQFALRNNRPDIILKRMGLGSEELIEHYYRQYGNRLRKSGFTDEQLSLEFHVPLAEVVHTKEDGKFVEVKFKLSDSKYNIKRYNIYINDVPLFGAYGKEINGKNATLTERLELTEGKNKIEIATTNEQGAESYRALTFANFQRRTVGDLYFIGFGVSRYKDSNFNLKYADKDVTDLALALSKMKGRYNNIFIKMYLNEEVTPGNIKRAKEITNNAKVDDTVVLFIAGHGMHDTDKNATYYYLTHNADVGNLSQTAVTFDDIETILQGVPPRNKLFLMDTCESGEMDDEDVTRFFSMADKRGIRARSMRGIEVKGKSITGSKEQIKKRNYLLERDRYIYNDLSRRSGTIVFSSSKGREFSYESDQIRNGFFTREIINALGQKAADKNSDGILSTNELQEYVGREVGKKTGGLQTPTVDRDNLYQKFGFPFPLI